VPQQPNSDVLNTDLVTHHFFDGYVPSQARSKITNVYLGVGIDLYHPIKKKKKKTDSFIVIGFHEIVWKAVIVCSMYVCV